MPGKKGAVPRIKVWPLIFIPAIIGSAFFVFMGSQRFFFSQDDFFFLYRAAQISSFRDFVEALASQDRFFYRPFSRVVLFFLQWKLFGLAAAPFHIVNIAIHALNGFLVFLIINHIFRSPFFAGISAVLFVSHPLSFLAVYWISGIQDLSMTAFVLLSLWLYLKDGEAASGRRFWWLGLSLATFTMALCSKESGLVAIVLLPFVDWAHGRETNPSRPWRLPIGRLSPYLAVLFFYILFNGQTLSAVLNSVGPYAMGVSLTLIAKNFSFYLREFFYLNNATFIPTSGITVASYFFLAALTFYSLKPKENRTIGALAIGWFITALLPVLFVAQRRYSYYGYLSLVGMVNLLALPLHRVLGIIHGHYGRGKEASLRFLAEGMGLFLLLFLWLGLSLMQIRAKEFEDPAGILAKSFLAQTVLQEIKARYPEIPTGSTLYLTGAGERQRWALGHGDLFKLIYPGIRVSFVDNPDAMVLVKSHPNVYWFQIPGGL
jgi:hypothetical protein